MAYHCIYIYIYIYICKSKKKVCIVYSQNFEKINEVYVRRTWRNWRTVEKKNVKVQRKQKWIALSASLWNIIHDKMDKLRTDGYVLYLTKAKRLEVITFANQRFVSLVEHRPGSDFKSFINFSDEEWISLQAKMGSICAALINCDACNNLKRPILVLQNRRTAETKLKPKKVTKLQEYNLTVENQLGIMCLYCGVEVHDDCHCHEYDCFFCEPHNFCAKCHRLTVYPAV